MSVTSSDCSAGSAYCLWRGKLTLDDGHDGTLLDSRRTLETIGVDSTEELRLQVHVVEGVGDFIVVGLDLACAGLVSVRSRILQVRRLSLSSSLLHCGGKAHLRTATAASKSLWEKKKLTLGHILKTFVSHDCDWGRATTGTGP